MNTIRLKDCHEEGDGSIIERNIAQLEEGTRDWIGFSTSDEVKKEWLKQLKKDPVSVIVECYEANQGFVSVDKIGLKAFCKKNTKGAKNA